MDSKPKVAVIILTLNQKNKTIRCLRSLNEILYPEYKIFLLDNGSSDNTVESVQSEFPEIITFFSSENLGVAGGRNFAAQKISEVYNPEYFLFLDNDTIVEKDFLIKLIEAVVEDKTIAIATSKIMSYGKNGVIYGAGGCDVKYWRGKTSHVGYNQKDVGQYDRNRECISSGGCMLVNAGVFNELGGFDESFNPYGPEDLDFVLRVKEKKYKCIYIYSSVIYHDPEPGKTLYQGKAFYIYALKKLELLKMFNSRHAPKLENWIFSYFVLPLLKMRALVMYHFNKYR